MQRAPAMTRWCITLGFVASMLAGCLSVDLGSDCSVKCPDPRVTAHGRIQPSSLPALSGATIEACRGTECTSTTWRECGKEKITCAAGTTSFNVYLSVPEDALDQRPTAYWFRVTTADGNVFAEGEREMQVRKPSSCGCVEAEIVELETR